MILTETKQKKKLYMKRVLKSDHGKGCRQENKTWVVFESLKQNKTKHEKGVGDKKK
jgi:hypothetical protein